MKKSVRQALFSLFCFFAVSVLHAQSPSAQGSFNPSGLNTSSLTCSITASSNSICAGDSVVLTATFSGGGNFNLPTNLLDKLVAWYPFNGNSNDGSPNANHLTNNENIPYSTDRFGNPASAPLLNGVNQFFSKDFPSIFPGNSSRTISCWINQTNQIHNNSVALVGIHCNGSCGCNSSSSLQANGALNSDYLFWGRCNDKSWESQRQLNTWYHLVLTYTPGSVSLYINGELINTKTLSGLFTVPNILSIGGGETDNNQNDFWPGYIDDVALYDRAISSSEIQQLYNLGKPSFLWSNGATTPTIKVAPGQNTSFSCTITLENQTCEKSLNINVRQPSAKSLAASVFEGENYPFNGQLLTQSGTYTDTLVNAAGCDSIVTLTLSVNPQPLNCSITANKNIVCPGQTVTLTASATGGSNNPALPANLLQGLVSWYPFNGNSQDESGNGLNLVNNGSIPFSTDRFGKPASAPYLNGINQYFSKVLSNGSSGNTPRSISCWINQTGEIHSNSVALVGIYCGEFCGCNSSSSLQTKGSLNSDYLFWGRCNDKFWSGGRQLNTWYHLAMTFTGSSISLYINGQLIDSYPLSGLNTFTNLLSIGGGPTDNNENGFWPGSIDDVALYNRALSATEVEQLYSGNTYAWSSGEDVPVITVNPTQTTTYTCTITKGTQSCTGSITITVNQPSGNISASIVEGESYSFNGQLLTEAGTYLDTLVTTSGCDSILTLNLTVIPLLNCSISASQNTVCQGQPVTLTASSTGGADNSAGLPSNLRQGLVAWYPFNGNSEDESGNGKDLANNGDISYIKDRFGNTENAPVLNGTNQYFSRSSTDIFSGNSQRTISCWINQSSEISNSVPLVGIYKEGTCCCNTSSSLETFGGPNPGYLFWGRCKDKSWNSERQLNTWYHLAMIYTGNSISLYVNGELLNTLPLSDLNTNPTLMTIGGGFTNTNVNGFWSGSIDDVALYDRALSPAEVQQLFNGNIYSWSTGENVPVITVNPTQTTTYTCTITNGTQSCTDSVVVTVSPGVNSATSITECGSYTWSLTGITYTNSGTYTFDNGCGTDTLYLTINNNNNSATSQINCGPFTWNGQTYSSSGTYTFDNGCGTDTLFLTVNNITNSATSQTACGPFIWNGQSYSSSGTYTFNNGCGTDTLYLSIISAGSPSGNLSVCVNRVISPITQATSNATGIGTATGLPGGVNAAWSSNNITLSGTPSAAGTFNYSIPLLGGNCTGANATGTITVLQGGANVGAPQFSPGSGDYQSAQLVALSSSTAGATIYYTTNGNIPRLDIPNSFTKLYTGPISVSATTRINAIAIEGCSNSNTSSANYNFVAPAVTATPTATPAAGTYAGPLSISLSCTTPGASIYYALNGNVPVIGTTFTFLYSGPFSISASTTLRAFAAAPGFSNSATLMAVYQITNPIVPAATPVASPGAGPYSGPQTISLTCSTPGSSIYYTTNGNNPIIGSAFTLLYSGPFVINASTTIRAIAEATGFTTSAIFAGNYTISNPIVAAATPVISPGTGTNPSPQLVTMTCSTPNATIYYTTNGNVPKIGASFTRIYTGPFSFARIGTNTQATIRALATAPGFLTSGIRVAVYTWFGGPREAFDLNTDENSGDEFTIYPNPSSGRFFINIPEELKSETLSLEVWNASGKRIWSKSEGPAPDFISLEDQPNGIYILKANTEKTQKIVRLVKAR